MNITELTAKPTEELVDQLLRLETNTDERLKNITHEEALYRLLIGYAADQGIEFPDKIASCAPCVAPLNSGAGKTGA